MSVVLPASGCEIIAKVRRRAISGGNLGRFCAVSNIALALARNATRGKEKRAWRGERGVGHK